MIGYAIAFIAGGYIIPASMHFVGVYKAEKLAPDHPTNVECFMSALIWALTWPLQEDRYEGR
jgi:hypothetical protein